MHKGNAGRTKVAGYVENVPLGTKVPKPLSQCGTRVNARH